MHDGTVHFPRQRVPDRIAAEGVGRLVDKYDAMGEQPFEGGRTVVGKGTNDFAVVVPIVGKTVRPDHRPVGQIAEQQIRGILDAVFLLDAGPAAERNIAATDDGVVSRAAPVALTALARQARRSGMQRSAPAGCCCQPSPTTIQRPGG